MKWTRRLGFLVLLLVILVVVGLFYIADIAKKAIEAGGEKALGVTTTVEGCDVRVFSGTFGLDELRIANPQGFKEEDFLSLGAAEVDVPVGALLSGDKIHIPKLELEGIRLNLVHGVAGSNYGTIMDNLKGYYEASKSKSGEGKRFAIDSLVIQDVEIKVVPMEELFTAVTIPLPRREFRGLGSDSSKGLLLAEILGVVVEAILRDASVSTDMPKLVGVGLKSRLGKINMLTAFGASVFEQLPEDIIKGVKNLGSRIPGLGGK